MPHLTFVQSRQLKEQRRGDPGLLLVAYTSCYATFFSRLRNGFGDGGSNTLIEDTRTI